MTVTPIQLADAYAALANGGTLYSPRIGEALASPVTGQVVQRINPPAIRRLPVSGYTLSFIRSALAGVVAPGHRGRGLQRLPTEQSLRRR